MIENVTSDISYFLVIKCDGEIWYVGQSCDHRPHAQSQNHNLKENHISCVKHFVQWPNILLQQPLADVSYRFIGEIMRHLPRNGGGLLSPVRMYSSDQQPQLTVPAEIGRVGSALHSRKLL